MANQFTQLTVGTNAPGAVAHLQKLLNEQNGAGLPITGIFDQKTHSAVKAYQRTQKLNANGIVDEKTWKKLMSGRGVGGYLQEIVYQKALEFEMKKNPFRYAHQAQMDEVKEESLSREEFSYLPEEDPVYQQEKLQAVREGERAMEDAEGKAAVLTGGFENSYGKTAARKAYEEELAPLESRIPKLYQLARSKYEDRGKELQEQYDRYLEDYQAAYQAWVDEILKAVEKAGEK